MTSQEFSQLTFKLLDLNHVIKPFNCGDNDLNEFLFEKAKRYKQEYLATTFIIESSTRTIAYYSIFNDSLNFEQQSYASKSAFKRFLKDLVTHPKRHLTSFPALKIGRLGIDNTFKGKGLGKMLVHNIINDALELNNKQACKLITVDAYCQSLQFYSNLGFEFLTDRDVNNDTRQMFFNLSAFESEEL